MHEPAENMLKEWVPGPLASQPEHELERAARWIIRRLRETDLPIAVRDTLSKLKDSLEAKLGRHIVDDQAKPA